MFGSIYVGLSGLDAFSRGLKQVSNNVANLNSQGFKASIVSFRNVASTSGTEGSSYAASGSASGHGVGTAETRTSMTQGELRQTDRNLDLAVSGSGFLALLRGSEVAYTRTGSFEVDKDGFVVLAGTDYRLATLDQSGRAVAVSIDGSRSNAPQATTKVTFSDNLSSSTASYTVGNLKVIDASGGEQAWKATLTRASSGPGEWTVAVSDATGKEIGSKTLTFVNGIPDPTAAKLDFTDAITGQTVTFDFTNATSFSSGDVSTLRAASTDGYRAGILANVAVNEKGQLELGFSNGQKKQLGAVAIADFRDPQALTQRSGGLFTDSGGADGRLLTSEDGRAGTVLSRRLEASNVDLSKEFSDLILIQRGFQASSQIISVANDMIQQLFGIRGQG